MTKQASEFESHARSNKNIVPLQYLTLKYTKTILFQQCPTFKTMA